MKHTTDAPPSSSIWNISQIDWMTIYARRWEGSLCFYGIHVWRHRVDSDCDAIIDVVDWLWREQNTDFGVIFYT